MKSCCIEGCDASKKDVTLFEFPTSRLLRKRWMDAINPANKLAVDAQICSQHFSSKDYEDIRGKIRLKSKVVPTVFGDEALNPKPPKDPLGLLESTTENEESQESTETDKESLNNDNHNGKVDDHSKEVDDKSEKVKKCSESPIKDNKNGHTEKVANDSENVDNCSEKNDNHSEKVDIDNEKVDNDNGKVDNDNKKVDEVNGKDANDNEKDDHDKEKLEKDTEKVDNCNENVNNDSEKVDNDNEKPNNDSGKVVYNENVVQKVVSKRVKTKWVPMRKVAAKRNGHLEMSEDSSSQDSVNSDLPPAPVLEDLEEHLPNYQIANMKTERQVAAMTETVDPIEDTMDQEIEEITIEPHVPVFIELSVGQDNDMPDSEQPNDCLMVLESVQCDIDPTLMLEARAEDEECCEQIDLDDDDESDDDVVMKPDDGPTPAKVPKKPKPPLDPISLLTSSDEDDVILQEPHIDTLSVSDETDEDDLPLQKLIKRERKSKTKKKRKTEAIKNILVGTTDFYCTHCQHLSPSRSSHNKHVRTHKLAEDEQKDEQIQAITRVYQICKECGFTTSSKSQLHRHQRKHVNEKRFKCPLCSYRSKYNMSLMYHLKTHDFDPNMYNCGACGIKLDNKKALLEHQKSCYKLDEKFMCGVCGLVSRSKRSMKIHRNTVHKQKA